jgi:hypothetical protein
LWAQAWCMGVILQILLEPKNPPTSSWHSRDLV